MNSTLNITLIAYDAANAVDIFGPLQVFASANAIIQRFKPDIKQAYSTHLTGIEQAEITLATQTRVLCDSSIAALPEAPIDTLLIAGGEPAANIAQQPELVSTLLPVMTKARRVASICSGALILAATGVLNGRKATTHWGRYDQFRASYPAVNLDIDQLFTQDGKYYCSAGVTAGIDLALKLVEQDFGHRVALETAREMVVFYHRPGGQNQFGALHGLKQAQSDAIKTAQQWVHKHLSTTLSVNQLADLTAMSVRHFSRRFKQETDLSPSRYIAQARLNQARLLLEETNKPINRVAAACGYQSDEIMRRLFIREFSIPPSEYRKRFHLHPQDSI